MAQVTIPEAFGIIFRALRRKTFSNSSVRIALRTFVCLATAALLLALAWAAQPIDQTISALTASSGFIESGTKFDVSVDTPTESAAATLRARGLRAPPNNVENALQANLSSCGGRYQQRDEGLIVTQDQTWRHGIVCLFYRNDRVTAIGWSFSPLELP
jgi:hypothetical protein